MDSPMFVSSADAPVKSVVVYADCAIITRQWVHHLKEDSKVIFQNVRGLLDTKFLRVSINCDAEIRDVVVLNHSQSAEKDLCKEQSQELETVISKDKEVSIIVQSEIALTENHLSAWESYISVLKQGNPGGTIRFDEEGANNFMKFLKIYYKECKNLEKIVLEQCNYHQKLEDSIAKNHQQLKKITEDDSGKDLMVSIAVAQPANVTLTITHRIKKAKWTSKYDLTVNLQMQQLEISYIATIQQNSSEKWENVAVTLSGSVPHSPGTTPTECHNNNHAPPKPARSNISPVGSSLSYETDLEGQLNSPKGGIIGGTIGSFGSDQIANHLSVHHYEQVTMQEIIHLAKIQPLIMSPKEELTVPGDDTAISVVAAQFTLPVQITHKCTPNVSTHVYIHIEGVNSSNYVLLAGSAKVFLSRNFLAMTTLPAINPLQSFQLWFGADPDVRSRLKPSVRSLKEKNNEKYNVYVCGYEIENDRSQPITVTALWSLNNADEHVELLNKDELEGPTSNTLLQKVNMTSNNQMEWLIKIPPQSKYSASLLVKSSRQPSLSQQGINDVLQNFNDIRIGEDDHDKNSSRSSSTGQDLSSKKELQAGSIEPPTVPIKHSRLGLFQQRASNVKKSK